MDYLATAASRNTFICKVANTQEGNTCRDSNKMNPTLSFSAQILHSWNVEPIST